MKLQKWLILTVLASLSLLIFFSCAKKHSYTIEGNIKGLKNGTIYLMKIEGGELTKVDSTQVMNEAFTFKGTVTLPEIHVLSPKYGDSFPGFFLENSPIKITGSLDSLKALSIVGSKSQDILKQFKTYYKDTMLKYQGMATSLEQAEKSKDTKQVELLNVQIEALNNDYMKYLRTTVSDNKKSVVGLYLLLSQLANDMSAAELDSTLATFDSSLKASVYMTELNKKLTAKKNFDIGKQAPDFTLNDPNGKPVSLASFKGKYVLLDFWASWCSPCRGENPNLVKAYKKYNPQGFEIFGVSLDDSKDNWLKGIKEDNITWTQVSDVKGWKCEAARLYSIESIPASFLLDKEGVIIAKNLRGEELEKKLAEIYSKK